MNSNKLEMVKCESLRINVSNNHTEKSVNFPVAKHSTANLLKKKNRLPFIPSESQIRPEYRLRVDFCFQCLIT